MNELLTVGELKKFLENIPDTVECVTCEKRYNQDKNEWELKRQSPIHTLDYAPGMFEDSSGIIRFYTCYRKTGQLGLDDYL